MHKNQKLGLIATTFLVAGFGGWYLLNHEPTPVNAGPVTASPASTPAERLERRKEMILTEIPEGQKKVEHALDDRWGHLGEEVLTAASVNGAGDMVYFDKEVHAGLTGDGKVIYAQGIHRAYLFEGPVIREVDHEPITLTITGKKPGDGFFAKAVRNGHRMDRSKFPAAKKMPGDK